MWNKAEQDDKTPLNVLAVMLKKPLQIHFHASDHTQNC